jgi:diguanylate cyclase (GGDEF)-like protein
MVLERAEQLPVIEFSQWRDRWMQLVSWSPDAFLEVDASGVVVEWNPRAEAMFGWDRDEVVGRPMSETLVPAALGDSPFSRPTVAGESYVFGPTPGAEAGDHQQFELMHRSGRTIAVEGLLFATGFGDDRCVGGFIHHADEYDLVEAALAHADRHDSLTGLPNRAQFCHQLAQMATGGGVQGSIAVVLLDLDRFKAINNTMGHATGDRVLAAVAERLRMVAVDTEVLARFGGDEFLALVHNVGGNAQSRALAFIERVRRALAKPFEVAGVEIFLDASFGIALNTFGVDAPAELLANAEAAMYRAKHRGGSRTETFGESMRIEVLDRMRTEHSLHRALERTELTLH